VQGSTSLPIFRARGAGRSVRRVRGALLEKPHPRPAIGPAGVAPSPAAWGRRKEGSARSGPPPPLPHAPSARRSRRWAQGEPPQGPGKGLRVSSRLASDPPCQRARPAPVRSAWWQGAAAAMIPNADVSTRPPSPTSAGVGERALFLLEGRTGDRPVFRATRPARKRSSASKTPTSGPAAVGTLWWMRGGGGMGRRGDRGSRRCRPATDDGAPPRLGAPLLARVEDGFLRVVGCRGRVAARFFRLF